MHRTDLPDVWCIWSIWPSFSDRSRDVAMATNFGAKRRNWPSHLHSFQNELQHRNAD